MTAPEGVLHPSPDTRAALELTDTIIAAVVERAAKAICPPLDDTCYDLAFDAAKAFAERTPKGWCLIGWVVRESDREAWDTWYNVNTGEGRLRQRPETM